MLGWDEVCLSVDLRLRRSWRGHGGMHHPKPAVRSLFEKPGANWEVEGGRRERGVVVEEQICSSLLSSELGSAPEGGMSQFLHSLGTSASEALRYCTMFVSISPRCFSPGVTLLPA